MPLPQRKLMIGATIMVNILGEHLKPKGNTCHSNNFKSKEFLDIVMHRNMEKGIQGASLFHVAL